MLNVKTGNIDVKYIGNMRIHKKNSLPARRIYKDCVISNYSVRVIAYNKTEGIFTAYYDYKYQYWVAFTSEYTKDFIWIYPPYNKLEETFEELYDI